MTGFLKPFLKRKKETLSKRKKVEEGRSLSRMCKRGYFRFQVGVQVQRIESIRVEKCHESRGYI